MKILSRLSASEVIERLTCDLGCMRTTAYRALEETDHVGTYNGRKYSLTAINTDSGKVSLYELRMW